MNGRCYLYLWTVMLSCLCVLKPLTVQAFNMAEYWPIKAGVAWVMDHEVYVSGSGSYQFGSLSGQQVFSASIFCDDGPCGGNYFYLHSGLGGLQILGLYNDGSFIDLSPNPFTIAAADMDIGDVASSTVPAGVLDPDYATSLTAILLSQESVTVPAGTYQDTVVMQLQISETPGSQYVEKVWLAKNVGPVKIERVSETPGNDDCFFTCGSFNRETEMVVARVLSLSFVFGLQPLDVNNDGQLGLAEAIHNLKVVSGQ